MNPAVDHGQEEITEEEAAPSKGRFDRYKELEANGLTETITGNGAESETGMDFSAKPELPKTEKSEQRADRASGKGTGGDTKEEPDEKVGLVVLKSSEPAPEAAAEDEPLVEVVHSIAGRIRVRIPELRWSPSAASKVIAGMSRTEGVLAARANVWCSSVTISYDPETTVESEVVAAVRRSVREEEGDEEYSSAQGYVISSPIPKGALAIISGTASAIALVQRTVTVTLKLVNKVFAPAMQLSVGLLALSASLFKLPSSLTTPLVVASIAPIASRAIEAILVEKKPNVDALDGIAAIMMLSHGRVLETSFMTALIATGEFIREQTARKCERLVKDLLGLAGRFAWLVKGKKRICVPAGEVVEGDVVVVYPGELIPVDGLVIGGSAAVDQSKLTGESHPVEVEPGHEVYASTVSLEGKIYVRCTATGTMTKAGRVLDSINSAPMHETRMQNYASVVADKMVVPIFAGAIICFALTRDIVRTMTMLIFDFTTGIRISAPTAVLASMHRAGRHGILIKSGAALEKLASVDTLIFDKTGTLTSGEPRVTRVVVFNGYKENHVLQLASAVEQRLHHPASRAIVKYAQSKELEIPERVKSEHMRGMGVKAEVEGQQILVGSRRLMETEGIPLEKAPEIEEKALQAGESLAYIAIDGKLEALICYNDQLRPEAVETIKQLKRLGVKRLIMATGDHELAADQVAKEAGITDVYSKAFPEQKAELVASLKRKGYKVGVIGDGINDSPALAHADVAISLHGGTEAARHSADVILTDDDLRRLPESIRIARGALQLVRQNITLTIVPNTSGLGLAAMGMIGPATATLLNNGSAICSALNSLRPLVSSSWSKAEPPPMLEMKAEKRV